MHSILPMFKKKKKIQTDLENEENIVENAINPHFLLFPQCFKIFYSYFNDHLKLNYKVITNQVKIY